MKIPASAHDSAAHQPASCPTTLGPLRVDWIDDPQARSVAKRVQHRVGGALRLALGEAAEFTLAWRGVVGAGFALPRDADRRSAFQAVPALLLGRRYAVTGVGLFRDGHADGRVFFTSDQK